MSILKILLGLVVLTLCQPGYAAQTRMTQSQAIQRAIEFSSAIGAPETSPATAEFPAHTNYAPGIDAHWQQRWMIRFADGVRVEIVDATGIVVRYARGDLPKEVADQPAGVAISQDVAMRKGSDVLSAAGQTSELVFRTARLQQHTSPPKMWGHQWYIHWDRHVQGIPYRAENAVVILQAETGTVLGIGVNFRSPPISNPVVNVSRDQAAQIALAHMARMGLQNTTPTTLAAEIIQPNTYWQPGGSYQQIVGGLRAAWVARFATGSDDHRTYEVWIDTETGELVGGLMTATGAVRRPGKDGSPGSGLLQGVVANIQEVRLYGQDRLGVRSAKPLASLDSKLIDALKSQSRFGVPGPEGLCGSPACRDHTRARAAYTRLLLVERASWYERRVVHRTQ